jgi:hypothetical protein
MDVPAVVFVPTNTREREREEKMDRMDKEGKRGTAVQAATCLKEYRRINGANKVPEGGMKEGSTQS